MATALRLARKGLYGTHPNPSVACIIADGERILGQGWHEFAGGPHAEVAALHEAGTSARGMTAYITLEPCSHQGRTPPCVEALIEAGINRVVIAAMDPNPLVDGSGLDRLRAAGITVEHGLMETEAEKLNAGFFKRMREGLPWVRVKSAISLDGRICLKNGSSQWISGEASRRDVQKWRARSAAILTGIGTVLRDDPRMTVRRDGFTRQPLRVVADSHWRTPAESRILADAQTAVIAGDRSLDIPNALRRSGARCLPLNTVNGKLDLRSLMRALASIEVNEVQVEAGGTLCGALLNTQLVDELLIYQAPVLLGAGGAGPFTFGPLESMSERTHFEVLESIRVGADLRIRLKPEYKA